MLKILLVDDEKQEREGVRFLIEKYGFPLEVSEAANGKAALEYIKKSKVDILFTDVKMPYIDGLELARKVHEYDENIAIIIFSAYSEFEYARQACVLNAVSYLLKPIELEEFEKVMHKVIDSLKKRKTWEREREFLKDTDKKMLLYKMVNFTEPIDKIVNRIQKYGIILQEKYLLFVYIETENKYFEKNEDKFNRILNTRITMDYEYINIAPNQSYVLLYRQSKFYKRDIEQNIKGIYHDIIFDGEKKIFIIVGESFFGTEKIFEQIQRIEKMKDETFWGIDGIQYLENIDVQNQNRIDVSTRMKDDIFESIKKRDLSSVKKNLEVYIQSLEEEKSANSFYAKYMLLDIVKTLYTEFGIYNQQTVFETSDKIIKSNYIDEIRNILQAVIDKIEKTKEQNITDESRVVHDIQTIINNEYMNDLNLNQLSERVFLTPAYISYVFKQETGKNFVKYLTDFRLEKAKGMLEEGKMKVVDVGKACGYPNQSYFNRLFKRNFGVTPKQFRENINASKI